MAWGGGLKAGEAGAQKSLDGSRASPAVRQPLKGVEQGPPGQVCREHTAQVTC